MPRIENKKRLLFLSASDRINYGDLLFPIICKEVFKEKDIQFENFGIIKSDLSHFGALPGRSYKDLRRTVLKDGGNIVIGGGEVLFADWQVLLSYLSPVYNSLIKIRNFRRLNKWLSLDKIIYNKTQNPFPFIIEKSEKQNVYYNAVGGTFNDYLGKKETEDAINSLNSAKVLSVRDWRTYNSLKAKGINAKLVPDSAIILSDLFPVKKLKGMVKLGGDLPRSNTYIFVQVGKNCAPDNPEKFVHDLEKIGEKMELDILLCPIGLASGHEDQVILKELYKLGSKIKYHHPKSIYEIMSLIAFSRAYMGTSLHGVITAQSYGVPFLPLNPGLKKVKGYCRTWASSIIDASLDFTKILKAPIIIESWDNVVARTKLKKQKQLAYQNFEEMWEDFSC